MKFVSKERVWHTYRCDDCGVEVTREAKKQPRVDSYTQPYWESVYPKGWRQIPHRRDRCGECAEAVAAVIGKRKAAVSDS